MKVKGILVLFLVLGLIFNLTSFPHFAFAEKTDKGSAKAQREDVKTEKQSAKESAKAQREDVKTEKQSAKESAKAQREEVKEFGENTVVTSSSTTTICHIPPGNPSNNRTITIGESALGAHTGHGDAPMPCEVVDWNEWKNNTDELKQAGSDENLIDQLTKQISDLQKKLQELLGL